MSVEARAERMYPYDEDVTYGAGAMQEAYIAGAESRDTEVERLTAKAEKLRVERDAEAERKRHCRESRTQERVLRHKATEKAREVEEEHDKLAAEVERLQGLVDAGIETERSNNASARTLLAESRAKAERLRESWAICDSDRRTAEEERDHNRRVALGLRAVIEKVRQIVTEVEADALLQPPEALQLASAVHNAIIAAPSAALAHLKAEAWDAGYMNAAGHWTEWALRHDIGIPGLPMDNPYRESEANHE